jgi:hypothetical protein
MVSNPSDTASRPTSDFVTERGQRQIVGIEPQTDAAHLDQMTHCLIDVWRSDLNRGAHLILPRCVRPGPQAAGTPFGGMMPAPGCA